MKGFRIFLACALGAFIGALVALQLSPTFWWIGTAVGFIVGYLAYEYATVLHAIRVAWKALSGIRFEGIQFRKIQLKKEKAGWWKSPAYVALGMLSPLTNVIALVSVFCVANLDRQEWISQYFIHFFTFLVAYFGYLLTMASAAKFHEVRRKTKWLIKYLNVFAVIGYWIPIGIFKLLRFAFRFTRSVVVFIHSDVRLLCGVDAAIGAGIGYFAGNALVGALAGGILGVANYYLAVKLLKPVPNGN